MHGGLRCPGVWPCLQPAAAFVFSFAGAAAVSWLPKDVVRPLVLLLLVVVLVYTVARPEFGTLAGSRLAKAREWRLALAAGAVLGFYDGFSGRGRAAS
jgi:uncharacterized membrane protein YfcA